MQRALLIEDNRDIAGMLFDFFECNNMELDYADNGELGLKLALENTFDIILLDLMLPRLDGVTVCQRLRDAGISTPILMLTALDSREDELRGLDVGADDYLTKPFDLDILYARAQALIRRHSGHVSTSILRYGDISIHLKSGKAYRQEKLLALTPSTFTILKMLVSQAPNLVTKEDIAYQLWQDEKPNNDVLRSHIYQLRSQLDKPFESNILKTQPKIGFYLEVNSDDSTVS
ncbi:response regulator transcription factor [Marinomonas gallaica]|uniref:response regulator transcription factor n=1 Tax=Marinomonas gallaica TaxID=1806667 RepID=UPI003A8F788E